MAVNYCGKKFYNIGPCSQNPSWVKINRHDKLKDKESALVEYKGHKSFSMRGNQL
jgi:hypothetical protein